MRITLMTLVLMLSWSMLCGQLNFTAGYRAGFVFGNDDLNTLLKSYSDVRDTFPPSVGGGDSSLLTTYFDPGFSNLSYLNGVDLGFLFRSDDLIFELGWKNKRKEITSTYVKETEMWRYDEVDEEYIQLPGNFSESKQRITTSINSICVGLQYAIGPVSIGSTVDYNWLRIRGSIEGAADPPDFKDQSLSSHFSLSFNFGTNGVIGFTLQPYVQLYWDDFEFGSGDDITKAKLNTFGIALIVRNGPQRPW